MTNVTMAQMSENGRFEITPAVKGWGLECTDILWIANDDSPIAGITTVYQGEDVMDVIEWAVANGITLSW